MRSTNGLDPGGLSAKKEAASEEDGPAKDPEKQVQVQGHLVTSISRN